MDLSTKSRTVFISQVLFWLNAAVWFGIGIFSLTRISGNNSAPQFVLLVIAILMFVNMIAMLIAGWWLGRQTKWGFLFAMALLGVNILLTFTDQVGILDVSTVLLDFGLVGLLLFDRKRYFC